MLPGQTNRLQAALSRLQPVRLAALATCAAIAFFPLLAHAQDGTAPPRLGRGELLGEAQAPEPTATPTPAPSPITDEPIAFEATSLEYDSEGETVTAGGDVILRQGDQSVRADAVTWNRTSGQIVASGDVRFVDRDGNQLFTDRLELTDELRAGAMNNLLLAFNAGGRLAATEGRRGDNGDLELERVVYSGCQVETEDGCPDQPSWRITASRVFYDAEDRSVRFEGAWFEIFGRRLLRLPAFTFNTDGSGSNGWLIPNVGYTPANGLEATAGYYWRLDPNRDLAVNGTIFTGAKPMVSAQYRQLTQTGAYQITGYATQGARIPLGSQDAGREEDDLRGYVFANGRFQLDPAWSVSASLRLASDRTFLRRYDISRDDRLRSTIAAERVGDRSYFSLAGWATQLLLVQGDQGQVPLALPVMDYRLNLADPVAGGTVQLQANTLALTRNEGQDTQRAFTSALWTRRSVTNWGQELTFSALVRGDVYHTDESALTATLPYRGAEGWHTRGIAIGAVDLKWPLAGEFLGGTQVVTPRIQLAGSPGLKNTDIPNEDSRAFELDNSNLFSLNRFPGYDRVEDGVRLTYGADYQLDLPGWRIFGTVGQSYRLTDKPALFPDGTGLTNEFSDYVGRVSVQYRNFLRFTHRFRLDKDSLGIRRNEIDATLGSNRTYLELGYLRLNRNLDPGFEDLRDREEVRAAGRVAFARYWSVFGAAVVNLTDRAEDPLDTSDGFTPVRTRLGFAYSDECLELGFTWRRDYISIADAQQGSSFRFHFALRNLGFR
ncbi:LPS-assembly protein LptD [Croceibacterium ferulae]|uniref:LPS-assembly protein LptD n=1 Tax=Croceibacterium ferulae TaxID=1854641 RepID=UPI000EB54098|nr:LPS assembly protein LptD [Croceibacterium ferulae]